MSFFVPACDQVKVAIRRTAVYLVAEAGQAATALRLFVGDDDALVRYRLVAAAGAIAALSLIAFALFSRLAHSKP